MSADRVALDPQAGLAVPGAVPSSPQPPDAADVLETALVGVHVADAQGRILWANPAALDMLGLYRDEVVGHRIDDLFDDPGHGERLLLRLRRGEAVANEQVRLRARDGAVRHALASANGRWQGGALVRTHWFVRDVTPLAHAEAERRIAFEEVRRHRDLLEEMVDERTRRLAEANRELEAFSYSVNHDLRAPLRAIVGFSDLLVRKHGDELSQGAQTLVQQLRTGATRMTELVQGLVDLSQYKDAQPNRTPVDLSQMSREVVERLRRTSTRSVEVDVEPDMVVLGDRGLLATVMDVLLGNAWKFTRDRHEASIRVSRHTEGIEQVIAVCDNGVGFDMALAGKLFRPFARLHRASEFEGAGMGLATVTRIIHRHGGRVWAEGHVGEGATFYFTLPRL